MNRPPFKRNADGSKRRLPIAGRGPITRRLGFVLVGLVAYSLFEFTTTGQVQWPDKVFQRSGGSLSDYASRDSASWRKAADAVESLGARREGQNPGSLDLVGRVVRVADGDTISILDSKNKQHKIRFFGIDAPERDQPYGQSASEALSRLVADKEVGVVIVDTDDYGRTVGTVYLGDNNINRAMLLGGYGWWYRYHAPHERHLEEAEATAREQRRGLWSEKNPIAPWDWRRGRR